MASALHPSLTCINIEADYIATALNGGVLRIMDGTQPPSAILSFSAYLDGNSIVGGEKMSGSRRVKPNAAILHYLRVA